MKVGLKYVAIIMKSLLLKVAVFLADYTHMNSHNSLNIYVYLTKLFLLYPVNMSLYSYYLFASNITMCNNSCIFKREKENFELYARKLKEK